MVMAATAAVAMDPRFAASLKRLDPETRLEQVCDLEAMNRISHDDNPFHPDRAKTDVLSHPVHAGDVVKGTGGAFRSKGRWYAFAFTCNSHNFNNVGAGCTIDYLAPGRAGDVLVAEAVEQALAGKTGVYDVVVTDQDGRKVALFRGKSHRVAGHVVDM